MLDGVPIGEAAEHSGVKAPTIRYYEQIGLLPAPPRTQGNRRSYGDADLRRLAFIRHARELGVRDRGDPSFAHIAGRSESALRDGRQHRQGSACRSRATHKKPDCSQSRVGIDGGRLQPRSCRDLSRDRSAGRSWPVHPPETLARSAKGLDLQHTALRDPRDDAAPSTPVS